MPERLLGVAEGEPFPLVPFEVESSRIRVLLLLLVVGGDGGFGVELRGGAGGGGRSATDEAVVEVGSGFEVGVAGVEEGEEEVREREGGGSDGDVDRLEEEKAETR